MSEKLTNELGREITLKEALKLQSWSGIWNWNPVIKTMTWNTFVSKLDPDAVSQREWEEILATIGAGPFSTKQEAWFALRDYLLG